MLFANLCEMHYRRSLVGEPSARGAWLVCACTALHRIQGSDFPRRGTDIISRHLSPSLPPQNTLDTPYEIVRDDHPRSLSLPSETNPPVACAVQSLQQDQHPKRLRQRLQVVVRDVQRPQEGELRARARARAV